jgi:hypothetical protein
MPIVAESALKSMKNHAGVRFRYQPVSGNDRRCPIWVCLLPFALVKPFLIHPFLPVQTLSPSGTLRKTFPFSYAELFHGNSS